MNWNREKKGGDEEGFKELSTYWVKLNKTKQVKEEWKAEKFNKCQIAHGMAGGVSIEAEKESELAQQEALVEENREKHGFQGKKQS